METRLLCRLSVYNVRSFRDVVYLRFHLENETIQTVTMILGLRVALILYGFVVSWVEWSFFLQFNYICSLKLVKGKPQPEAVDDDDKDMKIQPEAARELLMSALKVLSRSHQKPRYEPVEEIVMDYRPDVLPVEAPIALIEPPPLPPCRREVSDVVLANPSDVVPTNENGRRFVTAATGVATNPYTGVLHYVHYPVYYPSHPSYYG